MVFVAAALLSGLTTVSMVMANEPSAWHGGVSVRLQADGSAEIQESCGFISIQHWNDEGKPMSGEESSALPGPNRFSTPITVKAVLLKSGELEITIGDSSSELLKEGFEPSLICG